MAAGDEVVDGLYGLDPNDFVAARNDLAKQLRREGDKALAAEVARLKRPAPAAWAVNQLARRHRGDLEDLVRRGEALRDAQSRALAGEEAGDLRQAGRSRRESLARLGDLAARILAERGATAGAHAGEVAATLEAASLDPDAAAAVLAGRLATGLAPPSGFGAEDLTVAPAPRARPAPKSKPEPAAGGAEPEPGPDTDADAAVRRAAEAAAAATAAAAEARRRWEEAVSKARDAVDRVAVRRRAAQDAEAEVARLDDLLAGARRRLRDAARDAEQAEDAASRADDAVARAAAALREAEGRIAGPVHARASSPAL